ncbi:MAG: hypothetical protein AAGJ34_06810 [Pseudomonadota bacterium]
MSESDYGNLIAEYSDGTKIYQNGVVDHTGFYAEYNVGVINLGATLDNTTDGWEWSDEASFVNYFGPVTVEAAPSEDGVSFEISGSVAVFDIGILITENGTVVPMLGVGVGNQILGGGVGIYLGDADDSYGRLNRITVTPDGQIIETYFSQGTEENPGLATRVVTRDAAGEITHTSMNSISDPDIIRDIMLYGRDHFDQKCFSAGTQIALFDGSSVPIEDITSDHSVLSFNTNGEAVEGRVTRLLPVFFLACFSAFAPATNANVLGLDGCKVTEEALKNYVFDYPILCESNEHGIYFEMQSPPRFTIGRSGSLTEFFNNFSSEMFPEERIEFPDLVFKKVDGFPRIWKGAYLIESGEEVPTTFNYFVWSRDTYFNRTEFVSIFDPTQLIKCFNNRDSAPTIQTCISYWNVPVCSSWHERSDFGRESYPTFAVRSQSHKDSILMLQNFGELQAIAEQMIQTIIDITCGDKID